MKNLLFKTCLIFGLFLAISCGARKSDVAQKAEEKKVESLTKIDTSSTTNIVKKEETKIDDINKTVVEETIFEPKDPTRPATYIDALGKKYQLDNSKVIIKKVTIQNNTQTDSNIKIDLSKNQKSVINQKIKTQSETKEKAKKIDRDPVSWWNLLWLLIPVAIYLGWKKYKSKFWLV